MEGRWTYLERKSGWNHCYIWTNEHDIAELNCSECEPNEVQNYPHPNAYIIAGEIDQNFRGDIIAYCGAHGIQRETLSQLQNN